MTRTLSALLVALALISCDRGSAPVQPMGPDGPGRALGAAGTIPGRFIVTLRAGVNPGRLASEFGVQPDYVYSRALNGFAGGLSDLARTRLGRDARVLRIEPDGIVTIVTTQTGATWGLDRIDQRALPLSTTYSYNNTGTGVTSYIIDTGIRFDHAEFGGRAISGFDAVDGGTADDCHGHGTHVAGTVGGTTYGVAKGTALVAIRVLDCGGSGTTSGVIAGIDAVIAQHAAGPAVANLSLGGGASASLDTAVRNLIADGVATAVAAGNGNFAGIAQDACRTSPARVAEAMTISATDKTDTKASFANHGNCVDWFAPGVGITSAWSTSATATATISGTSMATPHTAGVAALYLEGNPLATPQVVRDALFANATPGIVKKAKSVNNHLLFSNY
ncbi:MAG: S8 family serine peptidase [Gemmatimonadota bacterium]